MICGKNNELVFVEHASQVSEAVKRVAGGKEIFTVTDSEVARIYSEILPEENVYVLDAGEDSKSMANAEKICKAMLDASFTRDCAVAALGGGVVGDLAGFVSSVYMRGVDFINVPTTLLAQVDSAIGGKTAVNLYGYKNMIGAFKMPKSIVICPEFLDSLPAREWRCGMGELVKTSFLCKELFGYVCGHADELNARKPDAVKHAVETAARFKKQITDEDPTEKGLRKILNLGHTVGHALEKCDGHKLSHGEYVTLGMKIEFEMLGRENEDSAFSRRADELLEKAGVAPLPCVSARDVTQAAKTDKKNKRGKISVIGLTNAGETYEREFTKDEFCERYEYAAKRIQTGRGNN